jgi:hypothetical protein
VSGKIHPLVKDGKKKGAFWWMLHITFNGAHGEDVDEDSVDIHQIAIATKRIATLAFADFHETRCLVSVKKAARKLCMFDQSKPHLFEILLLNAYKSKYGRLDKESIRGISGHIMDVLVEVMLGEGPQSHAFIVYAFSLALYDNPLSILKLKTDRDSGSDSDTDITVDADVDISTKRLMKTFIAEICKSDKEYYAKHEGVIKSTAKRNEFLLIGICGVFSMPFDTWPSMFKANAKEMMLKALEIMEQFATIVSTDALSIEEVYENGYPLVVQDQTLDASVVFYDSIRKCQDNYVFLPTLLDHEKMQLFYQYAEESKHKRKPRSLFDQSLEKVVENFEKFRQQFNEMPYDIIERAADLYPRIRIFRRFELQE